MTVYLRVHPDTKNYDVFDEDSWLYDTRLNDVDPEDLTGTDVLFRMTPAQFDRFKHLVPDGMFFRVFPDKGNTDINRGTIYNSEFREVGASGIPVGGTWIIIPATEEEFETFEKLGSINE